MFDATSGTQLFKLTASDAAAEDYFGGAAPTPNHSHVLGHDWANASLCTHTVSLCALAAHPTPHVLCVRAGDAVAASGSAIVVGADGNDDAGSSSGSAYVFQAKIS